jgi:hypothetical protein
MYSHELGSTRAKYTEQLGQSNNFLYTVSYQQIKPWSLLSEGNQSKSWEKVWAKNCLSLVTSHVVGTSRAEHTTSDMSYKQMKNLSSFTARQPIQILGKGVTSGVVVTGDGVYDTWDQFIAGVHKVGNIF